MRTNTHLLFYCERENELSHKIRAEFFKKELPFLEMRDKEDFFDALDSLKYNVVMHLNSQNIYNKVVKIIKEVDVPASSFRIICDNPNVKSSNIAPINSFDEMNDYVLDLALNSYINMAPLNPSCIHRIVSFELENIGVSKTYLGFKYILDLIILCIKDRQNLTSLDSKFERVGEVNLSNKGAVERDVRHMLNQCWKNNSTFRNTLVSVNNGDFTVNFKNLLKYTIQHFLNFI